MNANTVAKLIDHRDPDVITLAIAAITALPEETPILALADRLAELGETDREQRARQFAALLNREVVFKPNLGTHRMDAILDRLTVPQATLAIWLTIRWMLEHDSRDFSDREAVLLAALAPLGLARRDSAPAVVFAELKIETREESWVRLYKRDAWQLREEAENDLKEGARALLWATSWHGITRAIELAQGAAKYFLATPKHFPSDTRRPLCRHRCRGPILFRRALLTNIALVLGDTSRDIIRKARTSQQRGAKPCPSRLS